MVDDSARIQKLRHAAPIDSTAVCRLDQSHEVAEISRRHRHLDTATELPFDLAVNERWPLRSEDICHQRRYYIAKLERQQPAA